MQLESGEVVVQPSSGPQPPTTSETPADESTGETANEGGDEAGNEEGGDGDKKVDGEGGDKGPVKRPDKPPKVADPRELDAEPDSNGKISFSFNGQVWPDVLQWLANVSNYSLDWTELPAGYLNLTTQRPYSLAEARDLINRQLHARGYTMILKGEVLSVFKIDKLDPSLIPRVGEEDLYDLQPYDYVKITFQLPEGMEVAAAAEDVKKVVNEHARVIPLPATKRLLLVCTVVNARLVGTILNEERLAVDGQIIPVEIVLKHRRAEKIIDILYVILGLDPMSRPSQQELAVQQQKMQLLMQMQGAGKDVSTMLQKDGPQVYLAFNSHRNSVLINAPESELKKIRRAIDLLDVPAGGDADDILLSPTGRRVPKSYKLKTVDPKAMLSTLEEIGDLSPLTELRADSKADILFARASEADHEKIVSMIEQLDEAGMETMVFHLRKHPADAVAGTLRTMFAPKKEDESSSRSRRYRYYGWYGDEEEEEEEPEVRIDADIENNRLIVRAAPEQLEQVRDFLLKIGEPLDAPEQSPRIRVVEALDPAETARLLQKLRQAWPNFGDNELVIEGPDGPLDVAPAEDESEQPIPQDREARLAPYGSVFRFVADAQGAAKTAEEPTTVAPKKPPVVIKIAPDGRLLLSSEDTAALDRLERLIESTQPAKERFEIIPVRYVRASSIYLTLDLLYADEQKSKESEGYFDTWYWEYVPGDSSGSSPMMSNRKALYLDYDIASNTILVANASPSQLREIKMLIEKYDQPSSADDAKSRRTEAVKIKYSRAKVIAAALKEVYRDLLSQRDKEFETDEKKGGGSNKETTTIIRYGRGTGGDDDSPKRTSPIKVGFQGALSVGVDDISNTIIVSVQEELMDSVLEMIHALDEAAKPETTVAVHSVDSTISAEALQRALSEALGSPWVGGKPEKPYQEENGEGEQDTNEGNMQPDGPEGPVAGE